MREYTYIGIGSAQRTTKLSAFTEDMDQILPTFLNDIGSTIRVIHFDPRFDPDFLNLYFRSKGFDANDGVWTTPDKRIEVLIHYTEFHDISFLQSMMLHAHIHKSKLVVQMYTGGSLYSTANTLFKMFPDSIKKSVLFDITYGENEGCMTPMTEYKPITDEDGNFYNFLFFSHQEIMNSAGNPKLNRLISVFVRKQFAECLNNHSVNYRKCLRKEPFMFDAKYTYDTEEVMKYMLGSLKDYIDVLEKTGYMTPEKHQIFAESSRNYKEKDVYKWYSDMAKIYKD